MNVQSLVQIELPDPQGDDPMVVGFEPTWDIYPDAQGDLLQSDEGPWLSRFFRSQIGLQYS